MEHSFDRLQRGAGKVRSARETHDSVLAHLQLLIGMCFGAPARTGRCAGDGGVEIAVDFADEWQAKYADAFLIQSDVRSLHASELPEFVVLIGGIPCTSHSSLGRAKKGLAGKPDLGDSGDLFLPVLTVVSERMPTALVFENVPGFASSLAGELLVSHLTRLDSHVFTIVLQPNNEWGEIEDRKRWLLVATLDQRFAITVPGRSCVAPVLAYLDSLNAAQDTADADRIAATIEGLHRHNAGHQALGHGFGFTTIDGSEARLPTIPKCHHKIHNGPFAKRILRVFGRP